MAVTKTVAGSGTTATTTGSRPDRRRGRRAVLIVVACAALVLAALAWDAPAWFRDDDRPVDPSTPAARRAAAVALDVVPGRVLGVARDEDNGKWEITIAQGEREYEVELSPVDLSLLRLDYD